MFLLRVSHHLAERQLDGFDKLGKVIDAVLVATPDHVHYAPCMYAIRRDKHVYCQKPMTLTIREGRILSDACKQYGAIFQVGSQQRSEWAFRKACEKQGVQFDPAEARL